MELKKSLGQHFLNNTQIIEKIVASADTNKDHLVLEIGPGDGALTDVLLKQGNTVLAIETDPRMIEVLSQKYAQCIDEKKLTLMHADVMDWDDAVLAEYAPYQIVANIPYYITGFIIRKFLTTKIQPTDITFIMQKEVADRIMARDGKESLLSLGVKVYGSPSMPGIIKRGNFTPPPKVDSAILKISNISRDFFNDIDEEKFWKIVRASFSHKRKQLVRNLKGLCDIQTLKTTLGKLGVSETIRAEDISLGHWKTIVADVEVSS